MLLKCPRWHIRDPKFNPGTNLLLGAQNVNIALDRTKPMEGLLVQLTVTVGTQLTLTGLDNILGIIKKIRVKRPNGVQNPAGGTVVEYRGIGLIERAANAGNNLDDATLAAIALSQGATVAAAQTFRITYPVMFVRPGTGDPIASRCLLPCHLWSESPTIEVDFALLAEFASAGTITYMGVDIIPLRREPTFKWAGRAVNADGSANAGAADYFIPCDLIESSISYPINSNVEARLQVPLRGWYMDMQFCHYRGGASITRDVPDNSVALGAESEWTVQTGSTVKEKFLWKTLLTMNGFSRPLNGIVAASSPAAGLTVTSGNSFRNPASVMLDYVSDSVGTGDQPTTELGGCLDAESPFNAGQKVEYVGTPASVATNASVTYFGGHRLWGPNVPALMSLQ